MLLPKNENLFKCFILFFNVLRVFFFLFTYLHLFTFGVFFGSKNRSVLGLWVVGDIFDPSLHVPLKKGIFVSPFHDKTYSSGEDNFLCIDIQVN